MRKAGQDAAANVKDCLYGTLFGDAFTSLPEGIRTTYFRGDPLTLTGTLVVTVGRTRAARFFQRLLRLPHADEIVPVRLDIVGSAEREYWHRTIGDWHLRTVQSCEGGLMVERVGPLDLHFRMEPWERGVRHRQVAVKLRLLGVPVRLPRWASPRVTGFQIVAPAPDDFALSVVLEAPGGTMLVAYEGRIRREAV